tara:strand:- start:341 stop:562 length:222 start_codon:yes stop_codon:yes gene_type:complete
MSKTLRDEFAMAALPAIQQSYDRRENCNPNPLEVMAFGAYAIANAMMLERLKHNKDGQWYTTEAAQEGDHNEL